MLSEDQLAPDRHRPLGRTEFDQLVRLGAFAGERVELLQGVLVQMSPQGPPHASAVQRLGEILVQKLVPKATVRLQLPFAAGAMSEPEPDVAVVPRGTYAEAHPAEASLVVEVAESSTRKDRQVKQTIYARAGVSEYWVVDLTAKAVDVFRSPRGEHFTEVRRVEPGESIELLEFRGVTVDPADFLD